MYIFWVKIADTTKAKIYFIPSFRQYKLLTFSRGKIFDKKKKINYLKKKIRLKKLVAYTDESSG